MIDDSDKVAYPLLPVSGRYGRGIHVLHRLVTGVRRENLQSKERKEQATRMKNIGQNRTLAGKF